MKYCQYHPLTAAAYQCDYCQTSQCDDCVDEGAQGGSSSCFICRNKVDNLGARYSAHPFWRRFQEIFRYPLKINTIVFIIGMAILNIVIVFLPFTIIWFLILLGIFMKYCFSCLEKTAKGSLVPPNITSAYEGGIVLALKLIAILLIIGVSTIGVQLWLGSAMATFFGVLALGCCPAIIINFSLSESVIDAVNPLKILYLITAVGLPYGLLLAIISIMLGSVSFINELISNEASYVSLGLQITVSNYYTIVVFHLMGYMLFQYQGQLGFIARREEASFKSTRNVLERSLANIEIHVKEGYYNEALMIFQESLKKHGNNKKLHDKCFELLLATKNLSDIDAFLPIYIKCLIDNQGRQQLSLVYKKILEIHPQFIPKYPEVKLLLAQECRANGDSLSAVRLLNGLYRASPDFNQMITAMELMLESLRDLPHMSKKAEEFDVFLKCIKVQKKSE
jgi:tetratricopeptide (TPR) repeat protein